MKITQYLRLLDGSLIRLDLDRGLTTFKHGATEPISWKRTASEVVEEVITLVQADSPESNAFPWDEYARAAQLRGLDVRAGDLDGLPHVVLLSNDLAEVHEF